MAGTRGEPNWIVTATAGGTGFPVASKAAGGAGVVHVCTAIVASISATAAPAASQLDVLLKDGSTVLISVGLAVPAVNGDRDRVFLSGLSIPGSPNTAMSVEFIGALPANVRGSVNLIGYDA